MCADAALNVFAAPAFNVPCATLVAPVYVFAPDSVSVPVPCFVMKPPPLIAPLNVSENVPVSMTGSFEPVSWIALAIFRPSALKPSVVPSSIAKAPVPSAALLPRFNWPCLSEVPPV